MADDMVEIVAKHRYERLHVTKWEDEKNPTRKTEYRIDARSLLRHLAEKGCVRKAEDQKSLYETNPYKDVEDEHTKIRRAAFDLAVHAQTGCLLGAGFVRVEPLLPEEKP